MTTAQPTKKLTTEQKAAMKLFRERQGGLNRTQQQANRDNHKAITAILEQLGAAPLTIPELAQKTGLPPTRALWFVAAMRKYGQIREGETDGDYCRYELVETEDPKTASA